MRMIQEEVFQIRRALVDDNDEYSNQAKANMKCLMNDPEYLERLDAFRKVSEGFKKAQVKFALMCSMNLFVQGIVDEFHDIDFLIDIDDVDKARKVMQNLGGVLADIGGNGYCESDSYEHYQLGRVDVDVIAGFRLNTFGTTYRYSYSSVELIAMEGHADVYLIPEEAQYLLYFMMEGWQERRRYKRKAIEAYLINSGIQYPSILEDGLNNWKLPDKVRRKLKLLLN